MNNGPVIVSACLLGLHTRYDGSHSLNETALKLLEGRPIIPVCPEQLGGLPTPRPKAWISCADGSMVIENRCGVTDENGVDVTEKFIKGANETLKAARLWGAKTAFLKEKSPSCGVSTICSWDMCVKGSGVTAALLKKEGVELRGFY